MIQEHQFPVRIIDITQNLPEDRICEKMMNKERLGEMLSSYDLELEYTFPWSSYKDMKDYVFVYAIVYQKDGVISRAELFRTGRGYTMKDINAIKDIADIYEIPRQKN